MAHFFSAFVFFLKEDNIAGRKIEEKAIIKMIPLKKFGQLIKICNEHPTKNWNKVSVYRLSKRIKEDQSIDRRSGSGRPRSVTTEQNEELI